jgi:hypothetical protein
MKSRLSNENERTGSRKRKNSESTAEHAVSGSEADSDDLAHRRRRVRARLAEDFVSIPLQGRTSLRELIPEVPLTVVEQLDKSGALVHRYASIRAAASSMKSAHRAVYQCCLGQLAFIDGFSYRFYLGPNIDRMCLHHYYKCHLIQYHELTLLM